MDFEKPGEIYEPTWWDQIQPSVLSLGSLVMVGSFVIAFVAAAYLLYGLLSGGLAGFDHLPHDDRVRLLNNLRLAAKILNIGLLIGSIASAVAYYCEEGLGYGLFFGAAVLGVGVPYVCHMLPTGQTSSFAAGFVLASFVGAAYAPAIVGGIMIARDIVMRLISTLQGGHKPKKDTLTYGAEAHTEKNPVRMSIMAKCWEGPYCRDFIRPHCPIFIARKACWREKRGCYCEEDIVSAAAAKVNGVVLEMAPDPQYNFANVARPVGTTAEHAPRKPELSLAQKNQRCKYCVIYNQHEEEKYKLLTPVVIVGSLVLCAFIAPLMMGAIGGAMGLTQSLVDRFTFGQVGDATKVADLIHPNMTVEWCFVGAFSIMIVSKVLQGLEWMCFKAKI